MQSIDSPFVNENVSPRPRVSLPFLNTAAFCSLSCYWEKGERVEEREI